MNSHMISVLDPELALIGADTIDCASWSFSDSLPISYTENLIEEEPMFKANTYKAAIRTALPR
jgi:hypothetical protein